MNFKHLSILVLLSVMLFSCMNEKEEKLTSSEILELQKEHNDSILTVLDSLNQVYIYLPPLFDKTKFDSVPVNKFSVLARETNGEVKLLVNSKLIIQNIKYIIDKHSVDHADILFLMDKTGSMRDDIANVQKGLAEIIRSIKKYKNVRVAIALYGDKNVDGNGWYSFKNFETNLKSAKKFIKGIKVSEGGDYPESVYDGFFNTLQENFWKSENKRMIILIGDAPPLEKPLSDYSMADVISRATQDKVIMNFYPIIVMPLITKKYGYSKMPKAYQRADLVTSYYPNPSAGKLIINLEKANAYEVQVINSDGFLVLKKKKKGKKISMELYDLPDGVYVIRVVDPEKRFETFRLILEK